MNVQSNCHFRKFLFRIALAGLMLSWGLGMSDARLVHAQPAAQSPNYLYLPLVSRNYIPPDQLLTLDNTGTGSGTVTSNPPGIDCGPTCSHAFAYNTTVSLTALASSGSSFTGWSGSACYGAGTCTVKMDAARSVTATFTLNSYQLRIGIMDGGGSGTITSSPPGIYCGSTCVSSFEYNTVVTLTALPTAPSIFGGWSGAGCSGTGACTVSMSADQQVTATFFLPCSGIANCGFESGSNGQWTEYSAQNLQMIYLCSDPLPCNGISPHRGNYLAWFGGEVNEISYLQQEVPISSSAAYLVYWQWIESDDFCGYNYDYVEVSINGFQVDKYDLCAGASTTEWIPHSINLSAYAGQSVTLRISVKTDDNNNSNLFIDDVSLQAVALMPGSR